MNNRWIELEGAANVRDLGGLATVDGRQTLPRRLLRSDNLQDLTPPDIRTLVVDIGLTTIIDLRSTGELASEGPAPLDQVRSVRHLHRSIQAEPGMSADGAVEVTLVSQVDQTSNNTAPIGAHYLGYLRQRRAQVVAALRDIAAAPGAAIVHCAAGTDRTGVVVALALRAVGVGTDAVAADYAASGERLAAVFDRLRLSSTYSASSPARSADSQRPQPETMARFLGELDSRYGGVVKWLAAHGFGAEDVHRLRVKLLGSGSP